MNAAMMAPFTVFGNSTIVTSEKAKRLLAGIDWNRPELAAIKAAPEPGAALVEQLGRPPRPAFRFEYHHKQEMLAFLNANYECWRCFNTAEADRLANMPLKEAAGPGGRAGRGLAALGQAWWATGAARYGWAFARFYAETETGQMFTQKWFNGSQAAQELNAYFLLSDCPGFTVAGRIAFLDHLLAITENAWEYTSRFDQLTLGPEGHNWYLHGMQCLPLVGLLFPEFRRAAFFLRAGWSVVEEHLRGHYKQDGGARETCPGYQAESLRKLWDFYLIARRNGHPVSNGFAERLLRATLFLLRLMTPSAALPSYGDTLPQPGQLTGIAALTAALTGDRECKWYAEYARACRSNVPAENPGAIPYAVFWAVGLEGAHAYAAINPRNPRHVSVLMGPSGYAVLRDSDTPRADYLAVAAADRGPIVTSHGHNDVFALEVHARGTRFIGEMGRVPYGATPGRWYDQTTEAHTCLTVNNREQVPLISEWRWSGSLSPCVRRWISRPTHDFFHGVHEGYYQANETLHARKIFFLKSAPRGGRAGYWVVLDWLQSQKTHEYRAFFHGCLRGRLEENQILLGDPAGARLAIVPPRNDLLKAEVIHNAGLAAYLREKGLDAEDYPCFAFSRQAAMASLLYVLAPLDKDEVAPEVRRIPVRLDGVEADEGAACAVEIRFGGHTDYLCVSHKDFDADLQFGGQHARGFLAFRRVNARGQVVLRINHAMPDGVCGR